MRRDPWPGDSFVLEALTTSKCWRHLWQPISPIAHAKIVTMPVIDSPLRISLA